MKQQKKTDEEKVRDAWAADFDVPDDMMLLVKPKETEEDAQREDIANSDDARHQDNQTRKKQKLMMESNYIEDQAGVGKEDVAEESIEESVAS